MLYQLSQFFVEKASSQCRNFVYFILEKSSKLDKSTHL
jgi:hypothetical protein